MKKTRVGEDMHLSSNFIETDKVEVHWEFPGSLMVKDLVLSGVNLIPGLKTPAAGVTKINE